MSSDGLARKRTAQLVFCAALVIACSGLISPPVALAAGIIFGFSFAHPFPTASKELARFLLQASVVALGFGMNLHEVVSVGQGPALYFLEYQLRYVCRNGFGAAARRQSY